MAGKESRLSDKELKALMKKPGRYPDGNSLYFLVTEKLNCSWVFRYRLHGRTPEMGLGAYPEIMGKEARELRDKYRKLVRDGIDPINARNEKLRAKVATMTVAQAFEEWLAVTKSTWLSRRYESLIRNRFVKYAASHIGHQAVADIRAPDIAGALYPIWNVLVSAEELRQNLEATINWATAKGHRSDEKSNPAEWDRLKHLLPTAKRQRRYREKKHFPALPYSEAPKFMMELRHREGLRFRALELITLTAVRIGDVTGGSKTYSVPVMWEHIDLNSAIWRVPDTKTGTPHVVPLSTQAVALLREMRQYARGGFVFPCSRPSRTGALAARTIQAIFPAMGYSGRSTVHGFRSCFKSWASEETSVDKAVSEAALAHAPTALDKAYHRSEALFLQKRRDLMQRWADYLDGTEAKVIQLPKRA